MAVRQDKVQITIDFITDESGAFAKTLLDTKELNRQIAESRAKLVEYNKQLLAVGTDEVKRGTILAKIALEEQKVANTLNQIADEAQKVASIDLTKLTPAQLTERAKQLAATMRDIPQSAPQFGLLQDEIARVNGRLGELRNTAKGIRDDGAPGGGGFFGSVVGRVAVAVAAVQGFFATIQGLFGFVQTAVAEARAGAQAEAALASRIQSTGGAAGRTVEQLVEQATELQKITFFTDDQTEKAQEILLTFTNIRGEIFDNTIPLAQDLSTVFEQDLKSSAVQLGKALNDPVQGITALRRVGITFSADQEQLISRLVETNDVAAAQRVILEEVGRQVGGAAAAAAAAEGGPYLLLQQRLGEVTEGFGALIDSGLERIRPVATAVVGVLEAVTEALLNGEEATGEYAGTANTIIGVLNALAGIGRLVGAVFGVLYNVVLQPLGLLISNVVVPAFVGLGLALGALPRFISENRVAIGALVVGLVTLNAQAILAAANSLRMAAAQAAATVATNAQALAQRLLNTAMTANPMGLVIAALSALVAMFSTAYNSSEGFRNSITGLGRVATEIFKIIIEGAGAIARGFSQLLDGEFAKAGQSFLEGINKINPVGIAFTQGERIGKSYSEGYASGVAKVTPPDPRDLAEQARDDRQSTFIPNRPSSPGTENAFTIGGTTPETAAERIKRVIEAELKAVEVGILKQEVILENRRLKDEVSEREYQNRLVDLKRQKLEEQLAVYKKFKQEETAEALKVQNELLRLENETQVELLTARQRKLGASQQLETLGNRGPAQVTSTAQGTDQAIEINQQGKQALLLALRNKFEAALIAEQDYELQKLEIKRLGLVEEIDLLKNATQPQIDEIKKREEAKLKIEEDIAKKRRENSDRLQRLEQQAQQEGTKALGDVFQVAADLLTQDEKKKQKHAGVVKALQIANIQVNLAAEVSGIFANAQKSAIAQLLGPIAGTVLASVQAALAVVRATAASAKIQGAKFARGRLLNFATGKLGFFGGKPHSAGGTKGYFDDGTVIEVEKDEGFAIVNKSNAPLLRLLSNINALGGNGVPFFQRGGLVPRFDTGGLPNLNTTPVVAPVASGGQIQDRGAVEMLQEAAVIMLDAARQFPKTVRSKVVYQDVEDAAAELGSVREDASI